MSPTSSWVSWTSTSWWKRRAKGSFRWLYILIGNAEGFSPMVDLNIFLEVPTQCPQCLIPRSVGPGALRELRRGIAAGGVQSQPGKGTQAPSACEALAELRRKLVAVQQDVACSKTTGRVSGSGRSRSWVCYGQRVSPSEIWWKYGAGSRDSPF